MKRFIFKLLFFIILFFTIDLIIGQIFDRLYFKVKSGTIFNAVYGIQYSQEDILLLGASQVSHNFISKQIEDSLGLTCYNLGQDAHNIYYQYAMLREILTRYTPYVVIITTDVISEDEKTINSLFPFRKKFGRIKETILEIAPAERYKLISNAYAYNSLIIKIIQGLIIIEPPTNGYKPIYGTNPDIKLVPADTTTYSSRTLEYFDKFLGLAISAGSKVVVVNTPKYVDNSMYERPSRFNELISPHHVVYLDYENDTTYLNHPDMFKDKVHLNNQGAEAFTSNFISDLRSIISPKK